jgi:hypothetical protein
MFGKKKPALPPYTLQILTAESLIEGTVAGDASLYFAGQDTSTTALPLTSARIEAAGRADIPPRTCARFVVLGSQVVALIPRVDVTLMEEYEFWTMSKKPYPGVLYAGPYLVQGRVMLVAENHFAKQIPVFDARIASRVPGARPVELTAPFALVNFHWLYGFEPQ